MSTPIVYHCPSCGRVVHAEAEAEPPQCCGKAMVNACPESIQKSDASADRGGGPSETPPPVIEGGEKPG